jgi:hypothetical protein
VKINEGCLREGWVWIQMKSGWMSERMGLDAKARLRFVKSVMMSLCGDEMLQRMLHGNLQKAAWKVTSKV